MKKQTKAKSCVAKKPPLIRPFLLTCTYGEKPYDSTLFYGLWISLHRAKQAALECYIAKENDIKEINWFLDSSPNHPDWWRGTTSNSNIEFAISRETIK